MENKNDWWKKEFRKEWREIEDCVGWKETGKTVERFITKTLEENNRRNNAEQFKIKLLQLYHDTYFMVKWDYDKEFEEAFEKVKEDLK